MEILNAVLGVAILLGLIVSPYYVIKWLRAADKRSAEKNDRRLDHERKKSLRQVPPGEPERAFLKNCTNCGAFALTLPFRDKLGRTYCSAACMQWLEEGQRTFCKACERESTDKSSGNLSTINGIGTSFVGSSLTCRSCKSVVRRVWVTVFFVPLIPMAKYRVMQISPQQFLSRKLR